MLQGQLAERERAQRQVELSARQQGAIITQLQAQLAEMQVCTCVSRGGVRRVGERVTAQRTTRKQAH